MDLEKYIELKKDFFDKNSYEQKKQFGQFFTPLEIVKFMSKYFPTNRNNLNVLDPSFGLGILSNYLINNFDNISCVQGFEIDKKLEAYNILLYKDSNISINYSDYINSNWDKKYDFIIANPPYFKHHFIEDKKEIQSVFTKRLNILFDITTNIYCWFLLKSIYQLSNDGKLVYIIPSEFLNANYGVKIKKYLLDENILERIVKFDFNTDIFEDAITTSCILFINKSKSNDSIIFNNIHDIKELNENLENIPSITYEKSELDFNKKWRIYFEKQSNLKKENLILISDIGRVKRGIATGDNNYFIFNKSKAKSYNISKECLIPCICKSQYLKNIKVLDENEIKNLIIEDKELFLFNGIFKNCEADENYIKVGEESQVDKKYLTSKRKPWYSIEKRESADILIAVFSRNKLNFILNNTELLNLTCYHGLYLKNKYKDYKNLIFLYLNTETAYNLLLLEKREYGNGLNKFEPNDINKSHIINFDLIKEVDRNKLTKMASEYVKNYSDTIIEEADNIFNNYIFR